MASSSRWQRSWQAAFPDRIKWSTDNLNLSDTEMLHTARRVVGFDLTMPSTRMTTSPFATRKHAFSPVGAILPGLSMSRTRESSAERAWIFSRVPSIDWPSATMISMSSRGYPASKPRRHSAQSSQPRYHGTGITTLTNGSRGLGSVLDRRCKTPVVRREITFAIVLVFCGAKAARRPRW